MLTLYKHSTLETINTTYVLSQLIKELLIPVTRTSIIEEIEKHPDVNSLLSISEVLSHFEIPNASYELTFKQLIDAGITTSFIAYFSSNNGEFVLVHHLTDRGAVVSNERWTNKEFSTDEFHREYGGSILIAEKEELSGEGNYNKKRRNELFKQFRSPVLAAVAGLILLFTVLCHATYFSSITWQIAFLTVTKIAGLGVCMLLLLQSIDSNNPLVQKICGKDSKKSCNAILSSKAATAIFNFSWSEIGFFYFSGTLLILLLNFTHPNIIRFIGLFNIICLPYTGYSIYHQWRIAREWCTLCCIIQLVLWLECFVFFPVWYHSFQWPYFTELVSLLICMIIPVLLWIYIKPFFSVQKEATFLKLQLRKFKYNSKVFQIMLTEEAKHFMPEEKHSIMIGNKEAEHVITMVSNPYCRPCSKAHKVLGDWLKKRADIKLQIVFDIGDIEQYINDPGTKIATHLMRLMLDGNKGVLERAVNDWYEQEIKGYDTWIKSYPANNLSRVSELLEYQIKWCEITTIYSTPTFFIDGKRLPNIYKVEDLTYLI
ncbi:MAG: Vitamin epoxide reductase family protein [Sphingobacteriales bacterium]|nr:Vitamin epoxide reductase family protein [Sphingobacteriales bacterium]